MITVICFTLEIPWSTLHEIVFNATESTITNYPQLYKSYKILHDVKFEENAERLWQMLWIGIAIFIFCSLLVATIAILYVINRRKHSTGQFNVQTANKPQGT